MLIGCKHVFVYGTLKRGQSRASFLDSAGFIGKAVTRPFYRLYSVHGMYPALVEASRADVSTPGVAVEGEVFKVDDAIVEYLDVVEGVDTGLYQRRPIEVVGFGEIVESYFWRGKIKELDDIGSRW